MELIAKNYAKSAQDITEGGLSVALAECCIKGNIGVDINLEDKIRPSALLFGEGQSRIIISATKENLDRIKELAFEYHVPFSLIGKVGGNQLTINGSEFTVSLPIFDIIDRYKGAIPCTMNN